MILGKMQISSVGKPTTLGEGLLAIWEFDESSYSTMLMDEVSQLELVLDTSCGGAGSTGRIGKCIGSNSTGVLATGTLGGILSGLSQFTISFWIQTWGVDYTSPIISIGEADGSSPIISVDHRPGYLLGFNVNGAQNGYAVSDSWGMGYNSWAHVVCTLSTSGVLNIYVEAYNRVDYNYNFWGSLPGSDLIIDICGSRYNQIYSYFGLDQLAFWNRELTSTEINKLYNYGVGRAYKNF